MSEPQTEHELKPQEFEFESMHLQVGVRLQFITHRTLKPVQHFSTLIGWLKDEYLIVKMPMDSGAPIALVEGERVTIRVFSGIHVCSFACTVERVFGRPLSYLHISFPRTIQGTSLRTAIRVKVDIPARIVPVNGAAAAADCLLTNLSVSGARIESQKSLPQDEDEFDLEFVLLAPPNNQEVRVRARSTVRNISALSTAAEQAEGFAYGVQFSGLNPAHYTLLQNLTYEALLADRQKIV
ncbi:flagellar brake protein [Massilia sp. TW-1]|uniref:Flagellar brake protein n=1 Tax=Telluria antibiotica TaxID=2717319 RepID=A0ABX0PDX7_9BURK|nr:flagellar brake protein [Telluria antibiotica]NIA55566.1 flagellar brake protein [Telluria antibiotica]